MQPFVQTLIRRIGNPLEWSAAARAALACATVFTMAFLWALYFNWLVEDPARAPYLDPQAAQIGRHLQNLFVICWAALFAICMAARRVRLGFLGEPLIHVTAQMFTVHTMLVAHGFGLFTSPYGVLFGIVGMLLGSLMFGARPVVYGIITGVAVQIASIAGSQLGWFRYAPLLRGELVENGRLPGSWLILTGSWVTLCQMVAMLVTIYLLSQWQGREERLQEAYILLREQKQQLVRAESLASIGHLVTGAAHELRNPLASSGSLFQSLKEDIAAGSASEAEKQEMLRTIDLALKGQNRAALIAERLYSLSDSLSLTASKRPLEIVLATVARQYPSVRIAAGTAERQVPVLENPFLEIIGNLLGNALAAGGSEPPRLEAVLNGDVLEISVADNGCGIPAPLKAEVFKPFFTGRKAGEGHGVGLGLYIVHELAVMMHGTAALESEPGRGTRVTVRIPAESA